MKEKFGKPLSTTLNADECVARGCALMAAILSPLYKVRDFKVEDKCPHPIEICWTGTAADEKGASQDNDGDANMAEEASEVSELKTMEVFNTTTDKMDVKKY